MSEPVLCFDDLTLRRGGFSLKSITFQVMPGEIFAVLGKTGAGKTLLLEAAAGFCRPDGGMVRYQGRMVADIPIHQRNIGYLYQDYSLFPHMTVQENLAYGLRMQNRPAAEIRERVEEMARRFEIDALYKQYPGTLSGGEQQRVALARALMTHPPLLLLDEPFSALDPVTKQRLYRLLLEIRQSFGCAVVFVTHNFAEAEQLSDRVGVLIDGRLCGVARGSELFTADWSREVRAFLGISNLSEKEKTI